MASYRFLFWAAFNVALACLSSGHAHAGESPKARLVVKHPASFRILQFTDIHFSPKHEFMAGWRNRHTSGLMEKIAAEAKPDLLVVTGDCWPEEGDNVGDMKYAVAQWSRLGVPWLYAWGNHDQLRDFCIGHETLTKAPNSFYRGNASNGNYSLDLVDESGKLLWQIICLNTEREGFNQPQQAWLAALDKDAPPPVPRFAFFHIPIKQYADVWDNGTANGIIGERPCIEKEDGSALAVLKKANVRACFCGHDHVNDYAGVIDGVDLVYGRATGGYGMREVPKGGKLITFNCLTGEYSWVSIPARGKRWTPKSGERLNIIPKDKK